MSRKRSTSHPRPQPTRLPIRRRSDLGILILLALLPALLFISCHQVAGQLTQIVECLAYEDGHYCDPCGRNRWPTNKTCWNLAAKIPYCNSVPGCELRENFPNKECPPRCFIIGAKPCRLLCGNDECRNMFCVSRVEDVIARSPSCQVGPPKDHVFAMTVARAYQNIAQDRPPFSPLDTKNGTGGGGGNTNENMEDDGDLWMYIAIGLALLVVLLALSMIALRITSVSRSELVVYTTSAASSDGVSSEPNLAPRLSATRQPGSFAGRAPVFAPSPGAKHKSKTKSPARSESPRAARAAF